MNHSAPPELPPRRLRVDGETSTHLYLLKKVACLRATSQVRLAAARAARDGKQLVIRTPRGFTPHPSLERLIGETGGLIQIETF